MEERLEEILKIPGVLSVYAVNNRAEMITELFNNEISYQHAESLGARVVKIFAIGLYGKVQRKTSEIELLYSSKRVFAIDCGRYNLIIICDNFVQISMLRMTTNVLIQSMEQDKKVVKFLEDHAIDKKILLRRDKLTEEEINLLEKA